jgi:luciferase family oxidoreductase group 1
VLRRGQQVDVAAEFPGQVAELLGFLESGFPEGHPYAPLVAAPVVDERPDLFVLGSSGYGTQFAAVNGMGAAFAHHMSPELAVDALRQYRAEFRPGVDAEPWSAISVLAFASDDQRQRLRFEAGWRLTMANLRRGVREPLRPEEVDALADSPQFADLPRDDGRMLVGTADDVVKGLRSLQEQSQADEVVVVTPSIDRASRIASFEAIASAWR